jgi:hypothetical protein
MVKKALAAVVLAGLALFAVPAAANAADYVPTDTPRTVTDTGVTRVGTLADSGFDASVLLLPAGGVLLLGAGLVAVPIITRRRKANA